jgi:hypothetical protein
VGKEPLKGDSCGLGLLPPWAGDAAGDHKKTQVVDFGRGESFGFLGFDLRKGCNRFRKQFILRTPMRKKLSDLDRRVGRILKFPGIESSAKFLSRSSL